ncbi:hypothetical protein BK648_07390 [Pseudomonas poae]|uniref:Chemotaxis protein n=1 Tax=Pseudomonas poae TaxID=200451 RepID=A0A423FAL6_9PSED|nr:MULTISPECIES: hypothetical protein [Pseudomonas]ROM53367.1 hypothetical protein BK648_07390 [Pseudomonas poae]TFF13173.1 hypothetical protein EXW70_01175 [Pseudomonas sp. JMN1]TFF16143.1 hypothetical protein EXW71_07865 [Pseudomonas sp. BCA17]TFF30079.1 hypothetical protein EXW73_07100 [Pseudomonas sp. BCA13]TFF30921.1 hypothetical protein EXW72_02515 [Pseudomonas sp. BCA14]
MSVSTLQSPTINVPVVAILKPSDVVKEKDKDNDATQTASSVPPKATEGVKVTISGAGMGASKADGENSDIDNSNLSDNVKQLLKMIRELKKQLAEKMAELAAVMADTSMTPEARMAKLANLQSAVSALQASFTTAQNALAKALKDAPPASQLEAMSLASR